MRTTQASTWQIRPALLKEAVHLADCANLSYQKYRDRMSQQPSPVLEDYAYLIQHHQVWSVELDDKVIGFMVLKVTDEGFLLDNLAVHPAHQNQGIGRALLEHAEEQAKQQGFASIYLYTHETMYENLALYEKRGYCEYARREEQGLSRVYMHKVL